MGRVGRRAWKNPRKLIKRWVGWNKQGQELETCPKFNTLFWFLSKIFLIFIYKKQVYKLTACVRWNFFQNLIARGLGIRCPGWRKFEKLISKGRTSVRHQRWFTWIINTVKKQMSRDFNIFTKAADWVKLILKTVFEIMLKKLTQT